MKNVLLAGALVLLPVSASFANCANCGQHWDPTRGTWVQGPPDGGTAVASALQDAAKAAKDAQAAVPTGSNGQLQGTIDRLKALVGQVNTLADNLTQTLAKKPADMKASISQATDTLTQAADATAPTSEWAKTVQDMLNTAQAHWRSANSAPDGTYTADDKKRVVETWHQTIDQCNQVLSAIAGIHAQMQQSIQQLQMHANAVSELLLADQYAIALNSILDWVTQLKATANTLTNIINGKPNS